MMKYNNVEKRKNEKFITFNSKRDKIRHNNSSFSSPK